MRAGATLLPPRLDRALPVSVDTTLCAVIAHTPPRSSSRLTLDGRPALTGSYDADRGTQGRVVATVDKVALTAGSPPSVVEPSY